MNKLPILMLCALLAACGGGGGGSAAAPAAPAQPSATLALTSNVLRTVTGGAPVTLGATLSSGSTVRWKLADGAPGTLSADSGTSVKYLPPAINPADTPAPAAIAATTLVTVTATGDGASATLTLALSPHPGVPRLALLSGYTAGSSTEGTGLPVSFAATQRIAADGAGNLYTLEPDTGATGTPPPPRLRMIAPTGAVTTLAGAGTWFGAPDQANNAARLRYFSGIAADRAGNLYVSTAADGAVPASAAILKLTPSGGLSLVAGSETAQAAAIADGSGAAARFSHPELVGIDPDGRLYVRDANNTPRMVAPAGEVTTLKAFPASLNADMNGNTYRFDAATRTLVRTAPDGGTAVVAGGTTCTDVAEGALPACLGSGAFDIVPTGGASYALLSGGRIALLAVPQATPAPAALALSATTLRTIAGGAPVTLTATGSGSGAVNWKLAEGAPGTLGTSSGTSVTYTPPAGGIQGTTLVPVTATRDGASATLTLAVTPDPGAPGLYLLAGNGQPSRTDGVGAGASFMYIKELRTDLAGNIYVRETFNDPRPSLTPGFGLRRIAPDGTVTTLVGSTSLSTYWFGQPDPGRYDLLTNSPSGMALDRAGNLYLGQTGRFYRFGAGILKITPAGGLSQLAGTGIDQPAAILDGTGTGARFAVAGIAGIDYDDVLYVWDGLNLVRRVTTDGKVTTVPSVPRYLATDMNGNTYAIDYTNNTVVRTTPSGATSVVAGTPGCTATALGALPGCLPPYLVSVAPYGGSALLLTNGSYVVKLVLPH